MKLRARGTKVTVPSPPPALRMGGDATPVNIRRPFYNESHSAVQYNAPRVTLGIYVAPPKNPIWTAIPTSVKPTPYRTIIVR